MSKKLNISLFLILLLPNNTFASIDGQIDPLEELEEIDRQEEEERRAEEERVQCENDANDSYADCMSDIDFDMCNSAELSEQEQSACNDAMFYQAQVCDNAQQRSLATCNGTPPPPVLPPSPPSQFPSEPVDNPIEPEPEPEDSPVNDEEDQEIENMNEPGFED